MAYPNYYFPAGYQPSQMQLAQMSVANQQPQTTGFIRVPHEDVARNWNVPPGMSLTFIDENAPYCYIKTAGMSQLDRPKFEKYRLVKEEDAPQQPSQRPTANEQAQVNKDIDLTQYALRSDLNALQGHVDKLEEIVHKIELGGITHESADE